MGGMAQCKHGEYSTHAGLQCDECDAENSCDSKLKARHKLLTRDRFKDVGGLGAVGDALLSMVDELTLVNGIQRETQHQQSEHIEELRKERDDLRAKLAEAMQLADGRWHDAKKAIDRCTELEAKLAEVEKARALSEQWLEHNAKGQQMMVDDLTKRAEAAEARVRELEAWLREQVGIWEKQDTRGPR